MVLIGTAVPMHAGLAQEAGPAARDDVSASHWAAPASEIPAKLDTQYAPGGDKNIAGESGNNPPDGIDTRITVQPHASGKLGGNTKTKIELPGTVNLQRRTFPAAKLAKPASHNAVGVPVPLRDNAERHDSAHSGYAITPHANPTKPEAHIGPPAAIAKPVVAPAIANRGAINGTGLIQRGTGPSRIGGPSTAAVGINGTTIRPKH
jgi:hypothetical protein